MKSIRTSLTILALLPALLSCEMENFQGGRDSELKYSASLVSVRESGWTTVRSSSLKDPDGTETPLFLTTMSSDYANCSPATRGQLVNNNENGDYSDIPLEASLSTFYLAGWNSDNTAFVPAWTAVSWNGESWAAASKYYWKKSDVKTFFAYANLATGASVECTGNGGQKLSYNLPLDAASQKDILLGFAKGNGVVNEEPGIAEIGFTHPLTSIVFRRGIIKDDRTIKSIKIRGVASKGSVTMGADGSLSDWTVTGGHTAIVYQSKEGGLPLDDTKIMGEPFIIIPQNTAVDSVFVEIETTSGFRMEGVIKNNDWKAGTTNIYTVGYGETTHNLTITADTDTPTTVGAGGGTVNLTMNTTVSVGSGAPSAVFWKMQYSEDGATWKDFTDTDYPAMTGPIKYKSGFTDYSENSISIKPATLTGTTFTYDYKRTEHTTANLKSVWDANVAALQSTSYGTNNDPYDLSCVDINYENKSVLHNTANCYVVRGYGYFCLPLVYGNAIVNDGDNDMSYFPGTEGELARFKSSVGFITSPFIETSDGTDLFGCRYIWQDVCQGDEIVLNEDMSIINAPKGGLNCKYLKFRIRKENIKEGNVVLAATDKRGTILWSWHIWVTPKTFKTTPTSQDKGIEFLNYNLGWTDGARGISASLPGAKCYIRLVANDGSDAASNVIALERQNSLINKRAAGPAGPYYQWGRKDPQKPAECVVAEGSTYNTMRDAFSGTWSMTRVSNQDLQYSISHPDQCLYNEKKILLVVDQGGWYSEGEVIYHNLWSAANKAGVLMDVNVKGDDEKPIKTVYDPCPVGYQVPWGEAFYWLNHNSSTAFLNNYSAFDFTKCPGGCMWDGNPDLYFPAAGGLDHDDYGLKNVGIRCHYWTAVPQDQPLENFTNLVYGQSMTVAVGLFNAVTVNCRDYSRQAYGYAVRPVKE